MFSLFLIPLLLLCLTGGVILAVGWSFGSRKENRPGLVKVLAIPVGCVAAPIVTLLVLGAVGNLLQKSDEALAEEVFGRPTSLTGDRTLFDDFGSGPDRQIFMRAEMSDAERATLLPLAAAARSDVTLAGFAAGGASRGFFWWVSTDPLDQNYCRPARIREANGFNGWEEFIFAECLDAGTEFPQSSNAGFVYIMALNRND